MSRSVELVSRNRVRARDVSPRLAWPDGAEVVRTRSGDATAVFDQPYWIGGTIVLAHAVYWIDGRRPVEEGPWRAQADKIVWTDPATACRCMILRREEGHLRGFVGLPVGHPSHGIDHAEVAARQRAKVGGGLDYSAGGVGGEGFFLPREARAIGSVICPRPPDAPSFREPTRLQRDETWWLGFGGKPIMCNTMKCEGAEDGGSRAIVWPQRFQDDDHLFHEVVDLAWWLQHRVVRRR